MLTTLTAVLLLQLPTANVALQGESVWKNVFLDHRCATGAHLSSLEFTFPECKDAPAQPPSAGMTFTISRCWPGISEFQSLLILGAWRTLNPSLACWNSGMYVNARRFPAGSSSTALETLLGFSLRTQRRDEGAPFDFYEAAALKRAAAMLPLSAATSVGGVPARSVYDEVFSAWVGRQLEAATPVLARASARKAWSKKYLALAAQKDFKARPFLTKAVKAFGLADTGETRVLVGFLLRREADGSLATVVDEALTLLSGFDAPLATSTRKGFAP